MVKVDPPVFASYSRSASNTGTSIVKCATMACYASNKIHHYWLVETARKRCAWSVRSRHCSSLTRRLGRRFEVWDARSKARDKTCGLLIISV